MKRKAILLAGLLAGCSRSDNSVVFTKESGEKTKDVTKLDGDASYEIVGGRPVPPKAKGLHGQARAKGAAGDFDGAIKLLNEASAFAPDWPYPAYDLAYTYLLKGENDKAFEQYRKVDTLEPRGFFTAKTALWTLQRERSGQFPVGTYLAYLSLESAPKADKANLVREMTIRLPAFTPAWKERAYLTEDKTEKKVYVDQGLAMESDAETHGILLLNKAASLHDEGKTSEARSMLETAITNRTSTLATVSLAKEFLKKVKK